jgi:hypothetical protein
VTVQNNRTVWTYLAESFRDEAANQRSAVCRDRFQRLDVSERWRNWRR